tara:strand:+ start:1002 stop:1775 length:774 start_codon:yes stop_codon:yes gene_type:complete
MKYEIFFIDAFTSEIFSGNPAAVIFSHFNDEIMQKIAAENNLSETAFIDLENNYIRWFSPECEVDLCGHATLASAFAFFEFIDRSSDSIILNSNSGQLKASKLNSIIQLDFPKDNFNEVNEVESVLKATNINPLKTFLGDINLFAVFNSEKEIEEIKPNFDLLKQLPGQGLIISSLGEKYDFVSRYFCPKFGINEDPVTGSAHTTLIPYWSDKLNKKELRAKQISKRGGELFCINEENRVLIGGNATLYMKGEIEIN